MTVACLLITDGRPCLQETLASAEEFLFPYLDGPTVLVSDSSHDLGLSGAIRCGWQDVGWVSEECRTRGNPLHVFHLEDDFVFTEPVPVADMVALLEREKLAQVALKRDAVNWQEKAAGGFMQANPDNYEQRDGWTESRFGFTFNPCLYDLDFIGGATAQEWKGEAGLTQLLSLRTYPRRYAIFGNIDDPPRCFHIGHQRSAGWKL